MTTRLPLRIKCSVFAGGLSIALFALAMACGGGSGSGSATGPSSVTVISHDTGTTGASGATITVTAGGISPSSVSINIGQSVTFINNDSRAHQFASNPHPEHGSCPSIENGIGNLAAGQTKLTHSFADAGTCTFHDHLDSGNGAFQGSITIR